MYVYPPIISYQSDYLNQSRSPAAVTTPITGNSRYNIAHESQWDSLFADKTHETEGYVYDVWPLLLAPVPMPAESVNVGTPLYCRVIRYRSRRVRECESCDGRNLVCCLRMLQISFRAMYDCLTTATLFESLNCFFKVRQRSIKSHDSRPTTRPPTHPNNERCSYDPCSSSSLVSISTFSALHSPLFV
jgi:hypothetical protein